MATLISLSYDRHTESVFISCQVKKHAKLGSVILRCVLWSNKVLLLAPCGVEVTSATQRSPRSAIRFRGRCRIRATVSGCPSRSGRSGRWLCIRKRLSARVFLFQAPACEESFVKSAWYGVFDDSVDIKKLDHLQRTPDLLPTPGLFRSIKDVHKCSIKRCLPRDASRVPFCNYTAPAVRESSKFNRYLNGYKFHVMKSKTTSPAADQIGIQDFHCSN